MDLVDACFGRETRPGNHLTCRANRLCAEGKLNFSSQNLRKPTALAACLINIVLLITEWEAIQSLESSPCRRNCEKPSTSRLWSLAKRPYGWRRRRTGVMESACIATCNAIKVGWCICSYTWSHGRFERKQRQCSSRGIWFIRTSSLRYL